MQFCSKLLLKVFTTFFVTTFSLTSSASSSLWINLSDMGSRLEGHVIVTLSKNVTLLQCARQCTYVTNCVSFNYGIYGMISGLCELNSASIHTIDSTYLVMNVSYINVDIASWPQIASNLCSTKPCFGSEKCLPNGFSFICLSSDCDPPDDYNGASVAPGSNSLGIVRTYVCPGSKKAVGNNNITCLVDGWTSPNFTCEYFCNEPIQMINDATVTSGGTIEGSTRSYTCPSDRLLVGDNTITCAETTWSTPNFTCYYVCDEPTATLNDATVTSGGTIEGSTRSYICPSDRLLTGDNTITCTGTTWSTPSFSCDYVRSCVDLQLCDASYTDGEYWLHPQTYGVTPVKIYCNQMDTSSPKEFISVNSATNFAYNGATDANKVLTRYFQKIHVDIESMEVDRTDRNFSYTNGPGSQTLAYGMGSDCECESWCSPALGSFEIDTSNTGLVVNTTLEWIGVGYYPIVKNFARSTDGLVINANCGGYCGHCQPEGPMRLLEVLGFVRDEAQAVTPNCS